MTAFLRNCWYIAAWASELGDAPLGRIMAGEPVVLYRTAQGKAVALEDRCCHRNLPLSMGKIEGNDLRCGYHGLRFDQNGMCVEVPGQTNIPKDAAVRAYPLVERSKLLWIWMGDPAKMDETLLPDWTILDDPAWWSNLGNGAKPMHMKCDWQLNNDNLLDLSHVVYVHGTTLGTADLKDFPVRTERFERSVRMTRWLPGVQPMPVWQKLLGINGKVDRFQSADVLIPGHATIDAGFAPAGELGEHDDKRNARRTVILLSATPETETTSFLYYAQLRNFAVDNAELTKGYIKTSKVIFDEDVTIMEAQQRATDARRAFSHDPPHIDIHFDAPGLAMRRLVKRYMDMESK